MPSFPVKRKAWPLLKSPASFKYRWAAQPPTTTAVTSEKQVLKSHCRRMVTAAGEAQRPVAGFGFFLRAEDALRMEAGDRSGASRCEDAALRFGSSALARSNVVQAQKAGAEAHQPARGPSAAPLPSRPWVLLPW
mmetsp:Transcript_94901/g.306349  ORF Transcript_94901/g.306349 Transcript_94901/m.306349 type:complete len:135 (+) Transcript_94901:86-490(+)